MTTAEAARLLLGWDELLLLTHVRPDGDTVGSAAALCQALRDRGKTAYLLPNPEPVSYTHLTLPTNREV